jgi:hypothetical protein
VSAAETYERRVICCASDRHCDFGAGFAYREYDTARAPWAVSFGVGNILNGKTYEAMHSRAVVDEFGRLVLVEPMK